MCFGVSRAMTEDMFTCLDFCSTTWAPNFSLESKSATKSACIAMVCATLDCSAKKFAGFFEFRMCFRLGVGNRSDGGMWFAGANSPVFGVRDHSRVHILRVWAFTLCNVFARVAPIGSVHASFVASFGSSSALSLPVMSQCLGHHNILTVLFRFTSRNWQILLWKAHGEVINEQSEELGKRG